MTQLSFMDAVDAALPHGTPCGSWWWHAWKAGDAIPPGWRPPVPGADNPKPRLTPGSPPGTACEGDEIDMEVARAVDAWLPSGMVSPFIGIHETRRLACGAAWARLEAWDGGLSDATVRNGLIEWGHVPGAGALVPLEGRWTRLPAEEEALETSASAPSDVDPEPAVPVAVLLPSGGPAAFLHAHNLATDIAWRTLAESLHRTTPGDVRNAVARHVVGGSLTAANAAALMARLDAAEAPAAVEFPDVDPVYGTRRAPLAQPNFKEELLRKQAEGRAQKENALRPLRALADAGLAQLLGDFRRAQLLPPASDGLMLWYDPNYGRPKDVSLWITGPDVDPDILTRIEEILGVTAQGAATSIRLLK